MQDRQRVWVSILGLRVHQDEHYNLRKWGCLGVLDSPLWFYYWRSQSKWTIPESEYVWHGSAQYVLDLNRAILQCKEYYCLFFSSNCWYWKGRSIAYEEWDISNSSEWVKLLFFLLPFQQTQYFSIFWSKTNEIKPIILNKMWFAWVLARSKLVEVFFDPLQLVCYTIECQHMFFLE